MPTELSRRTFVAMMVPTFFKWRVAWTGFSGAIPITKFTVASMMARGLPSALRRWTSAGVAEGYARNSRQRAKQDRSMRMSQAYQNSGENFVSDEGRHLTSRAPGCHDVAMAE